MFDLVQRRVKDNEVNLGQTGLTKSKQCRTRSSQWVYEGKRG